MRYGAHGRLRAELWVNALLDNAEGFEKPSPSPANVVDLVQAKSDLVQHLVRLIDSRHRTWRQYPILKALAKTDGPRPEALEEAYLRFLRRDLGSAREPCAGSNRVVGSVAALRVVEGHSEGS